MHEHLDFRDALLSDPALRSEYQQLKVELAAKYKNDRAKYSDSKTEFVQRVLREWRAGFTSAAVSTSPDNP
jgi:GrpB-like predicted nucleotidyltransferase (UPF0157 family)